MGTKGTPAVTAPEVSASRNVVLVGPSGAGKTALARALAAAAGFPSRPGEPVRSVTLDVMTLPWAGTVITVLDTPGYADFLGELRAGLRAADAAIFVVSSVDGIDAATGLLWDECEAIGMPRAVVVTKLDRDRADFDETVAVAQRVFSAGVLPMCLPMHADDGTPAGFIDLLTTAIHDWSDGTRRQRSADPEHLTLIDPARTDLIEGIITESEDESLMDRFLAGEAVDPATLMRDLERAVARGHFHPVLGFASGASPVGAELILDLIAGGFPSPVEHPLPVATGIDGSPRDPLAADPSGPLCAEVVRTTSDPYTGKVSFVRVFSGTLRADEAVHVSGHFATGLGHVDHDVDERAGSISVPMPDGLAPVSGAPAGSIVAVARLQRAETGDTLSAPGAPLLLEPWAMPEPVLPMAIRARAESDDDRLGAALGRILAEDPTLRLERVDHADGAQTVLWTLGEAHADLVIGILRDRHHIVVDAEELRIALRETVTASARGTGRLVKQTGGHGQYAVCEIEVEPLPSGSGVEFVERVVGGAVPRAFIPSVERGIRAQAARGVTTGYPLTDVRVTLVDGRAHSVDSSDMAFQTAAGMALKDAVGKAGIALLEPVAHVRVDVDDDHVGAVLSDIAGRRGHVLGTESAGGGRSIVTASVPDAELARYAIDIRAITHGTGSFHREPAGYAQVPPARAKRLLAQT